MVKNHYHGSVAEPRARLLQAVLRFVLDARICQGVLRMALSIGARWCPVMLRNYCWRL